MDWWALEAVCLVTCCGVYLIVQIPPWGGVPARLINHSAMTSGNFWHEFFGFWKSATGRLVIVLIFVLIFGLKLDEIIEVIQTLKDMLK